LVHGFRGLHAWLLGQNIITVMSIVNLLCHFMGETGSREKGIQEGARERYSCLLKHASSSLLPPVKLHLTFYHLPIMPHFMNPLRN
jgi:hypothetical protein